MQSVLVEDNQPSAQILKVFLEQGGYEIHVAHDGKSGLGWIRTIRPAQAIIDRGLPKLCGLDVVRAVREDTACNAIIGIALTGEMDDERRNEALVAGFQ